MNLLQQVTSSLHLSAETPQTYDISVATVTSAGRLAPDVTAVEKCPGAAHQRRSRTFLHL
ncbi:hypothetical protein INR49_009038 [Caranx melampygus]|nr:hypothetical protein INR49_009038 [Caranx melampygus]